MRALALCRFFYPLLALCSSHLSAQVAVIVTSNVPGQPFTLSGTGCTPGDYTVPRSLEWTPGASCTATFASPYSVQLGTQYIFNAWQDGNASNPRTFTAPTQPATFTANFTIQYFLTVTANPPPGGTATGAGWYNAGTQVRLTATPAAGYQFTSWTLYIGASPLTVNPAAVTMSQPQTIVANFAPILTPAANHYTVVPIESHGNLSSLNDFGEVVGLDGSQAFLWTPSTANGLLGTLYALNPQTSFGLVFINNLGEVAWGGAGLNLWLPTTPNAATGSATVIPLGTSFVNALNNFGQAGGTFNGNPGIWTPTTPNGTTGAVTSNSQFQDLTAMNSFGQAIINTSRGSPSSQAILFTPSSANSGAGTFTTLAGLPGSTTTTLVAINDTGAITGYSTFPSNSSLLANQGFVWTPVAPHRSSGVYAAIPQPSGVATIPTAMNASADIVGTLSYSSGSFPFLYTQGVLYDLSGIDPSIVGATPQAINATGQIAFNSRSGVILATVTPAPPAPPSNAVPVTIASSVAGQPFTVTGTGCGAGTFTSGQTLAWSPGASCTVAFPSPYSTQLDVQYIFSGWQDGVNSNPRTFTTPAQPTSYTAGFITQYYVTAQASIAGQGTVTGGGWYNRNASATLTAIPTAGYTFAHWESYGTANPLTLTVTYPISVLADFVVSAPPGGYTVTHVAAFPNSPHLNNFGQVSAFSDSGTFTGPFLWTPTAANGSFGTFVDLPGVPEAVSAGSVFGLNDRGQVLGVHTAINASTGEVYLWSPTSPNASTGTATDIASFTYGYANTVVLNNVGQIGGYLNGGPSIWTPNAANGATGTFVANPQFAGLVGMNSSGQAIINQPTSGSATVPVLFTPSSPNSGNGTFTPLPGLSGFTQTTLVAISDSGTVVGYSCNPPTYGTCQDQGFIWTPTIPNGTSGTVAAIPVPLGFVSAMPSALNNKGDVVGIIQQSSQSSYPIQDPFLYSGGALYDLSKATGLSNEFSPVAINLAGQILFSNGDLATPALPAPTPPANAVPVSIASNPAAIAFAVTGTGCAAGTYATPQTLQWTPGVSCTVTFLSPNSTSVGIRNIFSGWLDGNSSNPRTFAAPAGAAMYTASFTVQNYLDVEASPAGAGTVNGSGWYNAGSTVTLSETPAAGYQFLTWLNYFTPATNPLTVTMKSPMGVLAYFAPVANIGTTSYSITTIAATGSPAGLNEFGQVAGTLSSGPFLWTPATPNGTLGSLVDLRLSPTTGSHPPAAAAAINSRGQVVGTEQSTAGGASQLFLWSPTAPNAITGATTDLPLNYTVLFGGIVMNDYGQVGAQSVLWTPAVPNGTTGTTVANPQFQYLAAMNDFGQAALRASAIGPPVLFTPSSPNSGTGTFTKIPAVVSTTPGAIALPAAISASGTVIGSTNCPASLGCSNEIFIWTPSTPHGTSGSLTLIPPPAGFQSLQPEAMNAQGDIVGVAIVPFIYTGGTVYALPQLANFAPGAVPRAINSAGQILFSGPNAAGVYLATPSISPPVSPRNTVPVTITANVAVSFSVTGIACSSGTFLTPQTLQWTPGQSCTVTFLSPNPSLENQFVFIGWKDGSQANPRTFTAPAQAATYTASFATQDYINVLVQPSGAGTVIGAGWYNQSSTATLTATPAAGYVFLNWVTSSGTSMANPLNLPVTATQTVTAVFGAATGATPGNYVVTSILQYGVAVGMNDFGQVAGDQGNTAILWTPSSPNNVLGSLEAIPDLSRAGGINARGQVAGTGYSYQPVLWSPGAPNGSAGATTAISAAQGGTSVYAINGFGEIGGLWSANWSIWIPNTANGTVGSTVSNTQFQGLAAMNDFGQAILNGPTQAPHSLLFTPFSANTGSGTFTPIPGLSAATKTTLQAINSNGTILGVSCVAGGLTCQNQGFLWTPNQANRTAGTTSPIPLPAGVAAMTPTAMNAQGDVAGTMQESNGSTAPFLYTAGKVYDLTALSSLLVGAKPVAINGSGQIVFNTNAAVYMATPVSSVSTTPPFGHIDTPDSNSSVAGAVSVTGWALSSPAVSSVGIWRETVPGETACVTQAGGECLVFLANATIIPGSRPDVALAYPGYPNNNAGWGLQVLTNELPNANGKPGLGNGAYRLHAIAANTAGQSADIATVGLTVDNLDSVLPFGTIDTPAPGATASGSQYLNFGWALTPEPAMIPLNGSTIWIFIDNQPVGHPIYNNNRSDIATLFPGLANSNGAVGYYYIDTTKLSNGQHSIAWSVSDSAGHTTGIGSRYFNVQN